jgi:hypothetical protein
MLFSQAAHDAAEHLGLPLVLLHQGPLGMILSGAGYNSANMYRWGGDASRCQALR